MKTQAIKTAKDLLTFDTYIGQKQVIEKVDIFIKSCINNKEALPHMLFNGPGGVGKTSLAGIISKAMNRRFVVTIGHNIRSGDDILTLLHDAFNGNEPYPIIFIDEIHLMPSKAQQLLYTAMEDWNFVVDTKTREISYEVDPFTIIGATTNLEKLEGPFISRFVLQFEFKHYSIEESIKIAYNYFQNNPIGEMNDVKCMETAVEIATRARGIARNVINLAYQIKHYISSDIEKNITYNKKSAKLYFKIFEIDDNGLIEIDYLYLKSLYDSLPDSIGLDYLSSLIIRPTRFIGTRIEPWLLSLNYIKRTKTGRAITHGGIDALKRNNLVEQDSHIRRSSIK